MAEKETYEALPAHRSLEELIEAERANLMQVHGMAKVLYDVLLYSARRRARRVHVSDIRPSPLRSEQFKKEGRTYFEALGMRVTQLRKSRGMTQAEMGRALGVSQQAVFEYEVGERRISVLGLQWLARVFRVRSSSWVSPFKSGSRS